MFKHLGNKMSHEGSNQGVPNSPNSVLVLIVLILSRVVFQNDGS